MGGPRSLLLRAAGGVAPGSSACSCRCLIRRGPGGAGGRGCGRRATSEALQRRGEGERAQRSAAQRQLEPGSAPSGPWASQVSPRAGRAGCGDGSRASARGSPPSPSPAAGWFPGERDRRGHAGPGLRLRGETPGCGMGRRAGRSARGLGAGGFRGSQEAGVAFGPPREREGRRDRGRVPLSASQRLRQGGLPGAGD